MLLNLENPVSRVSTNGFTRKSPCRYNILGTRSPHRRSFLAKENHVASDVVVPFPSTPLGNKYIAVFQDKLTTWSETFATYTTDAVVTANLLLDNIIFCNGTPRILFTDRGKNFL